MGRGFIFTGHRMLNHVTEYNFSSIDVPQSALAKPKFRYQLPDGRTLICVVKAVNCESKEKLRVSALSRSCTIRSDERPYFNGRQDYGAFMAAFGDQLDIRFDGVQPNGESVNFPKRTRSHSDGSSGQSR